MGFPWQTPSDEFEWDFPAPDLDERTWRQLKSNDPGLTSLAICWMEGNFVNKIDWTKEGTCFGDNTHLKKLSVSMNMHSPSGILTVRDNYEAFCRALALNRCIEHFYLERGIAGDPLCGLLEHNPNLQVLQLGSPFVDHERNGRFASALSRRYNNSSLRRLAIDGHGACNESTGRLVEALNRQTKLEELRLISRNSGESGEVRWMDQSCGKALVNLLQDPSSCLAMLHLEGSNSSVVDEEVANALSGALAGNRSLKSFCLRGDRRRFDDRAPSGLTRIGWRALLSSLGSNPVLEEINLGSTNIGDEGAELIARALGKLTSLTALHLNDCEEISSAGWRAFFNYLQGSTPFALETLDVGYNNIDDAGIASFGAAFSRFNSLKTLQLRKNLSITPVGWQAFGNHLKGLTTLEWLGLAYNTVGEEGAVTIGYALSDKTLKTLDLDAVVANSRDGWQALLAFLRNTRLLEALNLQCCDLCDDGLEAVSDSLANNESLKRLSLCELDERHHPVSPRGWEIFSTHLKNLTSLEELKLCRNHIDDPAAVALANVFESFTSLKYLYLNGQREISCVGWKAIARVLRNNSSLVKLDLGGSRVHLDAIPEFASSLTANRTLKEVFFIQRVRAYAYDLFSPMLCNQSSIATIEASNHTLESMGFLSLTGNHRCVEYLALNQSSDKNEVVREKLFRYYLQRGNANMRDFVNIDLKVMPQIVAAMARDRHSNTGQSLLFQLLKTIPTLVPPSRGKESVGTKRKWLG